MIPLCGQMIAADSIPHVCLICEVLNCSQLDVHESHHTQGVEDSSYFCSFY